MIGQCIGLIAVRPGHADVDRRRLAEVQHLIDDVGRLEEELQLRKALGQLAAQLGDQLCGRRVLLLERDEDFAVHGPDRRRIAQGDVHAAVGQADIVEHGIDLPGADELADRRLDLREIVLGLLDARARRRAHVQAHLAGVDLRKEIAPESGKSSSEAAISTRKNAAVGAGRDSAQARCVR